MPSNEFKRAVRAYMAAHPGVSYTVALRALSQPTNVPTPNVPTRPSSPRFRSPSPQAGTTVGA